MRYSRQLRIQILNNNVGANKNHINKVWLNGPRKSGLKATDKILKANFKDEPMDLVIMLSRSFGKEDIKHYHLWMFYFIDTILKGKRYFDWENIILDNIH